MAILAFAPGLQYRERKFTTPNGAAGPFLPGALLGAFPTARFRTILDIRGGLLSGEEEVGQGRVPWNGSRVPDDASPEQCKHGACG